MILIQNALHRLGFQMKWYRVIKNLCEYFTCARFINWFIFLSFEHYKQMIIFFICFLKLCVYASSLLLLSTEQFGSKYMPQTCSNALWANKNGKNTRYFNHYINQIYFAHFFPSFLSLSLSPLFLTQTELKKKWWKIDVNFLIVVIIWIISVCTFRKWEKNHGRKKVR